MNDVTRQLNEYIAQRYPETVKIASKRLGIAPNLCGLRDLTSVDSIDTGTVLMLTLRGGWTDGILAVLSDVAMFLGRSQEFKDRFGDYPIANISALLSDAITRKDYRSINAAAKALEHDRFRDRVDGGTWIKGKGADLTHGSLFQFIKNPSYSSYGQTFLAIEVESDDTLIFLRIEDSTGGTSDSNVRPDEPIWILIES